MSFNYTPYVAAAVIFIALTIPMSRFADWLQARTQKQRRAAATV
jgi:polar amino acid transport system permease protein